MVALTTQITKIATIKNPAAQRIRNILMHVGIHATPVTHRMAGTIEQQRVHYRHSPVVSGTGHALRPGDFFYLPGIDTAASLAATDDYIAIVVPDSSQPADPATAFPRIQLREAEQAVLKQATGLRHGGIVIVRPDGYIGHIGTDPRQGAERYQQLFSSRH